jgi:hypothetical protein
VDRIVRTDRRKYCQRDHLEHQNWFEHDAKSIVAGPSFMQYLNKLFKIQIAAGDILQFESSNHDRYFMFSQTGTLDEIVKLQ